MKIDRETATAHLRLLEKYRPCPSCGSERVTVRQDASTTPSIPGNVLRVQCSDCGFAREFAEP
jgi:transcription elongation factor Elf1